MNTRLAFACASIAIFILAGCAQPGERVQTGMDQATVIATLGKPKETYALPNGGKRLMWPTQPAGATTTAIDLDETGKVVSVRQVLQDTEFNRAEIDKWTRDDVLSAFGRPFETANFKRMDREVWSYRYVENHIDHLIFNFYFDEQGVLRQTQKQPDYKYDTSQRRSF
jgi:outer membrane protein assembly factor BamE (lipoprotein component of BamABCDE complex)